MPRGYPCVRAESRSGEESARPEASVAAAEAEIHAAAHHIALERDVVVGDAAAIEAAIHVAEIHMEIFGLGGPIVGERELDAAAGRPAGIGLGRSREARRAGLDIADREAARDIRQEPVERIAGAAPNGGEPVVVGTAAAGATRGGAGALEVRPVDIALEAEHGVAHFPIDAGGTADDPAREVEAAGAVPVGGAPTAAAVDP